MNKYTLNGNNHQGLFDKLKALDPTKRWVVSWHEFKSNRSLEQNRRLWDLYTAVGNYLGHDKNEIHELMGYKFLRYQTEIRGETVELIKSTTKLTTDEMAEYQNNIERWANQLGFYWEH